MVDSAISKIVCKFDTSVQINVATDVSAKLKFIASIPVNAKVNSKHLTIHQNNLFTSINRSLINTDNRTNLFNFLYNTIQTAISVINHEKDEEFVQELHEDLVKSIEGIQNLIETYKSDAYYIGRLQSLISLINRNVET